MNDIFGILFSVVATGASIDPRIPFVILLSATCATCICIAFLWWLTRRYTSDMGPTENVIVYKASVAMLALYLAASSIAIGLLIVITG